MSSIMPANSMAAMTCVETVTPPANLPTVESSRALKAQIDEIIANNKDVDACKLDVGDLVQLALSFFAGEWRTLKDIGAFVVTKIAHYNSLAAEYFFVRTHYPASPTFAALTRGMEG
jgi:phage gp29-like protein